jgi:hypothetical protein
MHRREGIQKRFGLLAVLASAALLFGASSASGQVRDLFRISDSTFDTHVQFHQVNIPRGGDMQLADLAGPGQITYFYITDNSQGRFYPGLVLKVYWDDEQEPSINVPLSDFFGAIASETVDYQSALMQINHYCYMSYLPMPFSKRARFLLVNDGDQDYSRGVAYGIDYEKGESLATEKSRLHCVWTRSNPTKDSMHTYLEARGRGHYVGSFLQVNSRYWGWWGEGDTIFHVDGKAMTHSPGTEDEYGSCWTFEHPYSYAYSGYIQMEEAPIIQGTGVGKNRMYRWYVANPVRFQHSLKVEIQNQHVELGGVMPSKEDYTSVAFWYQEDPHQHFTLQSYAERTAPSAAADYGKK